MAGSLRINVQLGPDGIGQERSIFTWLKVCITRLRQHLTSSLRIRVRGREMTRGVCYLHDGLQV